MPLAVGRLRALPSRLGNAAKLGARVPTAGCCDCTAGSALDAGTVQCMEPLELASRMARAAELCRLSIQLRLNGS